MQYGKDELKYLSEKEFIEDKIALSGEQFGSDWNFDQHQKIDTQPTLADFKKTVSDYLAWEVSQILTKNIPLDPK